MTEFRVQPVYRMVELFHPEYPKDAPALEVEVQRNLTNRQIDRLPGLTTESTTTMKELRDGIAPYVKSWNFSAEDESGEYVAVPAPMDGGGDVFKLMDDFFTFEIYKIVRYAHLGGPPGSRDEAERKNSLAASMKSDPESESGAATHSVNTSSTSKAPPESSTVLSIVPDPKHTTKKRTSPKTNTTALSAT